MRPQEKILQKYKNMQWLNFLFHGNMSWLWTKHYFLSASASSYFLDGLILQSANFYSLDK